MKNVRKLAFFLTIILKIIFYTIKGDKMTIYVDLVFLLNMFLDFILLMSVSVVLTRNTKLKKIILGSLIGGMSTFILFININGIILLLMKIVLGIIMVIVTFGYHDLKYTLNNLFYLLTISFSLGGVLYLFMNKGIYNYIILLMVFIIVCCVYVKQLKVFQENYANYYHVEIMINNRKISLTGYLDTGNKLYDQYKHRPIIIVSKKRAYNLEDIIYVPYVSLNKECILKCLKPDKIIVNNKPFFNYLVGLSDKRIQIDGVECILHSKMKGRL